MYGLGDILFFNALCDACGFCCLARHLGANGRDE